MSYHEPVMLKECLSALNLNESGVFVDVTLGGGGHAKVLLEQLNSSSRLFGFDQDLDSPGHAWDDPRFTMIYGNFRYLKEWMDFYSVNGVSGILADLGVSSHQLNEIDRGFTYRDGADLDMRMNRNQANGASWFLNNAAEEEIANVLWKYGDIRYSRKLANRIVQQRNIAPIEHSDQLVRIVRTMVSKDDNKALARVFQALRIEVNQELASLNQLLQASLEMLKPGGRLVVMSYHSLEDRIVKQFMRGDGHEDPPLKLITKKAVKPSMNEIDANPRSRSACLRIAEKK